MKGKEGGNGGIEGEGRSVGDTAGVAEAAGGGEAHAGATGGEGGMSSCVWQSEVQVVCGEGLEK